MDCLFTLASTRSELSVNIFPPIELDAHSSYTIGLYSLNTYNSIPNVHSGNNRLYYTNDFGHSISYMEIPEGSYELDAVIEYIQKELKKRLEHIDFALKIEANLNTMQVEIETTGIWLYFTKSAVCNIGVLFGFDDIIIHPGTIYTSNNVMKICDIGLVNVECNITDGSYINGIPSHTIFSFHPFDVLPGYKISLHPNNILYLPVNTHRISNISLRLIDQNCNLVNFRGEEIAIQLNLRKFN